MMRKPVILLLVFLLPVGVFLFLRYFGKNEFDIPVLHHEKVEAHTDCDIHYPVPYLLADSIQSIINPHHSKSVIVMDSLKDGRLVKQLMEELSEQEISFFYLSDLSPEKASWIKQCVLLMKPIQTAALIDDKKQIRGYYILPNRDEQDKLDVELKILLKKY
jgi:hypothetical protein